jgi:hypothetical protein
LIEPCWKPTTVATTTSPAASRRDYHHVDATARRCYPQPVIGFLAGSFYRSLIRAAIAIWLAGTDFAPNLQPPSVSFWKRRSNTAQSVSVETIVSNDSFAAVHDLLAVRGVHVIPAATDLSILLLVMTPVNRYDSSFPSSWVSGVPAE